MKLSSNILGLSPKPWNSAVIPNHPLHKYVMRVQMPAEEAVHDIEPLTWREIWDGNIKQT